MTEAFAHLSSSARVYRGLELSIASSSRPGEEMSDVAIAHHVVLAFDPPLARRLDRGLALELHQVVDRVDLGLDELLFEVGVDHARRLRCSGAGGDFPGADFFRPC